MREQHRVSLFDRLNAGGMKLGIMGKDPLGWKNSDSEIITSRAVQESQVFVIDEVAKQLESGEIKISKYPCVAAPFASTWLEYREKHTISKKGGETGSCVGVCVRQDEFHPNLKSLVEQFHQTVASHGEDGFRTIPLLRMASARLKTSDPAKLRFSEFPLLLADDYDLETKVRLTQALFYVLIGEVVVLFGHAAWLSDDQGHLASHPCFSRIGRMDEVSDDGVFTILDKCLHPVLSTFSLLSCRNITYEKVSPPEKLSKARKKKTGHGLVDYHVLRLNPLKAGKHQRSDGSSGVDGRRSLHVCAGSFATYSEARPLFGKYAGRFWRPDHWKGNREEGVVEKTYVVAPNKKETP